MRIELRNKTASGCSDMSERWISLQDGRGMRAGDPMRVRGSLYTMIQYYMCSGRWRAWKRNASCFGAWTEGGKVWYVEWLEQNDASACEVEESSWATIMGDWAMQSGEPKSEEMQSREGEEGSRREECG